MSRRINRPNKRWPRSSSNRQSAAKANQESKPESFASASFSSNVHYKGHSIKCHGQCRYAQGAQGLLLCSAFCPVTLRDLSYSQDPSGKSRAVGFANLALVPSARDMSDMVQAMVRCLASNDCCYHEGSLLAA